MPVARFRTRPSGPQRLFRIRGGTDLAQVIGETVPLEARTLLLQNPFGANVYLLFDNRLPRRPADAGGQDYDLMVPSTCNLVYPFPAGITFVSALVRYPAGVVVATDANFDLIARWSPVLYDPSIQQFTAVAQ